MTRKGGNETSVFDDFQNRFVFRMHKFLASNWCTAQKRELAFHSPSVITTTWNQCAKATLSFIWHGGVSGAFFALDPILKLEWSSTYCNGVSSAFMEYPVLSWSQETIAGTKPPAIVSRFNIVILSSTGYGWIETDMDLCWRALECISNNQITTDPADRPGRPAE